IYAAESCCASLTKCLGKSPLLLTELNLSEKITGDSAVQQLSDLLKDLHCRTKILKLNNCSITERGCAALSAALCSNQSHLIELDLSRNKLGDSGVKEISDLLKNSNSKLELLRLSSDIFEIVVNKLFFHLEFVNFVSVGLISRNCHLHVIHIHSCMIASPHAH
uniref:SPRY-associated domain-containing protein n=1 Tax=Astyanax mexicanus TaxID=7994 RepID=A0A8B9H7I4_ASTMX